MGGQKTNSLLNQFSTSQSSHVHDNTKPMYGFKDAWDYYAQISSCRVIPDIKVPCLSINSIDDPITGPKSLPVRQVSMSDCVTMPVSSHSICLAVMSA